MTYNETLLFIARALTINHEKHNHEYVSQKIDKKKVNWEKVVQLSTKHYVFPALYCNIKRAKLLRGIPDDLVAYMKHITDLNRARNRKIIEQAKEINSILKEHNIQPIFLKGTCFLFQDFYEDIGERMVGDIDFIVSHDDFEQTIQILKKHGYDKLNKASYSYPIFKHYDRLVKNDAIAAIEIHKEMIIEGYHDSFNYSLVAKDLITTNDYNVLSLPNQLCLSIIAKQINDDGQFYYDIALRNAYDVFLLSTKIDALESIEQYPKLFNPLNHFLAICQFVFQSEQFSFRKTATSDFSVSFFKKKIENLGFAKKHQKKTNLKLAIKKRLRFILQGFSRKENRAWMWNRFKDSKWQREKLIQFGLIKSKS